MNTVVPNQNDILYKDGYLIKDQGHSILYLVPYFIEGQNGFIEQKQYINMMKFEDKVPDYIIGLLMQMQVDSVYSRNSKEVQLRIALQEGFSSIEEKRKTHKRIGYFAWDILTKFYPEYTGKALTWDWVLPQNMDSFPGSGGF